MSAMYSVLVGLGVSCTAGMAVAGVAALTTGWTPPSGGGVLRPRLWGTGVLLSALGLTAFLFLGPLNSRPHPSRDLPLVGMAVNFVGLALQSLSRRPRPMPDPATKTVS